jgi:hypothetical protein
MIVWSTGNGGRYDPVADAWQPMSQTNAPATRVNYSFIWTGSRAIVWGGNTFSGGEQQYRLNTGGLYDPVADSWTPTDDGRGAAQPGTTRRGVDGHAHADLGRRPHFESQERRSVRSRDGLVASRPVS